MKMLLWFLLVALFSVSYAFSQNSSSKVINISSIPSEGLLLNKGWKFQAGDNPAWANTNYVDSSWNDIDPTIDIQELPEKIKTGIFWLRLHIYTGNSIRQLYSMLIQQSGASEIYLDDSLIYQFGEIGGNASKIKAYDPLWKPLQFRVNKNSNHVLAIRYQLQPHILYTTIFETANPVFWVRVMDPDIAINHYVGKTTLIEISDFIPIGIFLMMFILHTALYLVYTRKKGNLYVGLYAFVTIIGSILQLFLLSFNHQVEYKFYLGNSAMILFHLNDLFILAAITYLFEREWDMVFRILVILFVIVSILSISVYPWGWKPGNIFTPLIIVNIIRIAFISMRKKKRGAWIIALGGISSIFCFIAFIATSPITSGSFLNSRPALNTVFFIMFVLSLPTSVSLFLALDFAFANKSLQEKLIEVNQLSERNIMQESEKQQLLSSQNEMLEKQVGERTSALKQSLEELRATQAQLIQSEKMASLGELTAGIAHEIQNPLNFVNNFSEVNKELLAEMDEEISKGNYDEVKSIARDLTGNEEKINYHGKRADTIVKGMLQHSRLVTGKKEPTDLNALADEYLRLAYHGIRAKAGSFSAPMKTDFDPYLGKINIIPQDIGRVLLNLYNNAFYTLIEKRKQHGESFEPFISVGTKLVNGKAEIRVRDNGCGIPQNIQDKIFQPFFTTKPAGQGIGLGLSLSYDIVKAHGGELKMKSQEGEGTEFVVQIPVVSS
jgi:two-component system, NtrC family, sensor kinase